MSIETVLIEPKITIKFQQRNQRKEWTNLTGLHTLSLSNEDLKKLCKQLSKTFGCGASIKTENKEQFIQIQGDHVKPLTQYLVELNIVKPEFIKS